MLSKLFYFWNLYFCFSRDKFQMSCKKRMDSLLGVSNLLQGFLSELPTSLHETSICCEIDEIDNGLLFHHINVVSFYVTSSKIYLSVYQIVQS